MFHTWFDLPPIDPETGIRKKASAGSKWGKFVQLSSGVLRKANGEPYKRSELVGVRAVWQRKILYFGQKQEEVDGEKQFNPDGSKKMVDIVSKPTLIPVEILGAKPDENGLGDEQIERFAAFFEGKTDAEIQAQVSKADFSAEDKQHILAGRAKKALIAANKIVKGADKRYEVVD